MATTRCYGVHIQGPGNKSSAGCLVFVHRLNDQHRAAEFRLAASTFEDSGLSIPSSRQATFREQFRVANVTHDVFAGSEADDEQFIAGKMREAFGSGVEVIVTLIEPATKFGP